MDKQGSALALVTKDVPELAPVASPAMMAVLDNYLVGSAFDAQRLVLDLAAMMLVHPPLRKCTKESLTNALIFAARHKTTFGQYGVELVPRAIYDGPKGNKRKVGEQAVPSLAYRYKVEALKDMGVREVFADLVYEGDKFEVNRDGGVVVNVVHEYPFDAKREGTKGVRGAWGVAIYEDGRRRYKVLNMTDINRAKAASATKTGGPWNDDLNFGPMVVKTVKHRLTEEIVGDFTKGAGGGSLLPAPGGDDAIDADYEEVPFADKPDSSAAAADRLFQQGQEPDSPATATIEELLQECHTTDAVTVLKETEAFKALWKASARAAQDEIVAKCKARIDGLQPKVSTSPEGAATQTAPPPGQAAPAPEGTPQAPPFPDLPPEVRQYVADHPDCGLAAIIGEWERGWPDLEPVFAERYQEWGPLMEDEPEPPLFTKGKQAIKAALHEAGLPNQF